LYQFPLLEALESTSNNFLKFRSASRALDKLKAFIGFLIPMEFSSFKMFSKRCDNNIEVSNKTTTGRGESKKI